jgi:predicted  nucleic acid-binding Zn-ribbon protein
VGLKQLPLATYCGLTGLCECLLQAQEFLQQVLQKLEALESRVSCVNSTSISSGSSKAIGSQTVDIAVEAAVHLLERLLVTLQCLAADAGTISNAAAAAQVEVLIGQLMQGVQQATTAAAVGAGASAGRLGAAPPVATALTALHNAAAVAGKQRSQELEQRAAMLQLRLSDCTSQLSAALSASARTERTLQLKVRAVSSLERQLAAAGSQLQQLQASQASQERTILQLQQELAVARLDHAQLSAAATAHAGELQAAVSRAALVEGELQQSQAAAQESAASCAKAVDELAAAIAAGRQQALEAQTAVAAAAAAAQQVRQLTVQLVSLQDRATELEAETAHSRQKADIGMQAARDAEYRAVQTNTLLADTRRELDFTLKMLETAKQQQQQQQHMALTGTVSDGAAGKVGDAAAPR